MKTLKQRVNAALHTAKGELRVNAKEAFDVIYFNKKTHPCRYIGSGKWTSKGGNYVNTCYYLDDLGIDYETGNDAPRGGWEGNWIRLSPKGNRQVARLRRDYIDDLALIKFNILKP